MESLKKTILIIVAIYLLIGLFFVVVLGTPWHGIITWPAYIDSVITGVRAGAEAGRNIASATP